MKFYRYHIECAVATTVKQFRCNGKIIILFSVFARLGSARYYTGITQVEFLQNCSTNLSKNLASYENLQTKYFLSGYDRSVCKVKANGSSLSFSSISSVKILRYRHMEISRLFDGHFNLNVLHDNLKLTSLSVSASTRALFRFFALSLSGFAHVVSLNKERGRKSVFRR